MISTRLLSSSHFHHARQAAAEAQPASAPDLGALPEWNLADLYPAMDSELYSADLARAEAECKAFAGGISRQARSDRAIGRCRHDTRRRGAPLRGARGSARPDHVLCRPRSIPATRPIRSAPSSTATRRRRSRRPRPIFCSSSSNSIASTVRCSIRRWTIARSRIGARGSKISARRSRISSTTSSNSFSTRSRSLDTAPGIGCSTRRSPRCASTSTARN